MGKKTTISELVAKDAEDESLKRYKEALLGAAAQGGAFRSRMRYRLFQGILRGLSRLFGRYDMLHTYGVVFAAVVDDGDPRNVIIDSIAICVKDRPDIIIPLTTPADIEAMKSRTLVFKEGETPSGC